ncbi:MAG: carboxylesterase/lipase family protein [candidate division NC10 bacterium]
MRARVIKIGNSQGIRIPKPLLLLIITSLCAALLPGCFGGGALATVQLDTGRIKGFEKDGILTYLGIPFAAPPVGDLRWKPPQPAAPWEGVRECTKYGAACPQIRLPNKMGGVGLESMSEDCLYLNVWSPAKDPSERLPVMVWIHGGAFVLGAGSDPKYDGHHLAGKGAVIVTINYRLGPLGFLSHPLLSQESPQGSSGNYGLLDQIEALKWVQRNISAFGGDPGRVTIFGESAGAMSVLEQMVSPLSKGLFQGAISESGLFLDDHGLLMYASRTLEQAEQIGVQYAAELGVADAPDVLAALRAKSPDELHKIKYLIQPGSLFEAGPKFVPVVDGWVLPNEPVILWSQGKQHNVPLLVGSNQSEGNLFASNNSKLKAMSVQGYQDGIRQFFGTYGDQVLALFPVSQTSDIKPTMSEIFTLVDFTAPSRFAAMAIHTMNSKAYLYRFSRVRPGDKLGACHGTELAYVFGAFKSFPDEPLNIENLPSLIVQEANYELEDLVKTKPNSTDYALSDAMMQYWVNFATSGDPNGKGLVEWPAYDPAANLLIDLGDEITVKPVGQDEACEVADQFYGIP